MRCVFYFAFLGTVIVAYHQTDYTVIHERVELFPVDEFIGNFKYKNFKYNRTYAALNASATFKIDFNNAVRATVQGYKFMSNEYRLFPIVFDGNVCEVIRKDIFGLQNLYDCGTLPRCPAKKGSYYICNWQPDYHKFPPYAPSGSFRFDYNFSYYGKLVVYIQWYHTVKRDVPIPK